MSLIRFKVVPLFLVLAFFGCLFCGKYLYQRHDDDWIVNLREDEYTARRVRAQEYTAAKVPRNPSGGDAAGRLLPPQRNFTVVTAYFNLGAIQKGAEASTRGPVDYFNWMWPYRFMLNAVVAYFDDEAFAASFASLRKGLPTKMIMVNRSSTWAFSLQNQTQGVFVQADYPKKPPKSTVAAYACAMHAKYELVARAAKENPFGSQYFAWMDIGIFRTLPSSASGEQFTLRVPRCHRRDTVMFARVFPMDVSSAATKVLRDGDDWVGGGFFLGSGAVMLRFYENYQTRVEQYLNASLANHDQSVLLAMYLPTSAPRPAVPLQAVVPDGGGDPWFYLAMAVRREGLAATQSTSSRIDRCSYELHE